MESVNHEFNVWVSDPENPTLGRWITIAGYWLLPAEIAGQTSPVFCVEHWCDTPVDHFRQFAESTAG